MKPKRVPKITPKGVRFFIAPIAPARMAQTIQMSTMASILAFLSCVVWLFV